MSAPHATNLAIKALLEEHGISRSEGASLAMVSDSHFDRYLAPRTITQIVRGKEVEVPNPQYRKAPQHRLHLIRVHVTNPRIYTKAEIEATTGIKDT